MPSTARLSVSLPAALARSIRKAAGADGAAVSAWLADAAETKLLLNRARTAVRSYERKHRVIRDEELQRMERRWRG